MVSVFWGFLVVPYSYCYIDGISNQLATVGVVVDMLVLIYSSSVSQELPMKLVALSIEKTHRFYPCGQPWLPSSRWNSSATSTCWWVRVAGAENSWYINEIHIDIWNKLLFNIIYSTRLHVLIYNPYNLTCPFPFAFSVELGPMNSVGAACGYKQTIWLSQYRRLGGTSTRIRHPQPL